MPTNTYHKRQVSSQNESTILLTKTHSSLIHAASKLDTSESNSPIVISSLNEPLNTLENKITTELC